MIGVADHRLADQERAAFQPFVCRPNAVGFEPGGCWRVAYSGQSLAECPPRARPAPPQVHVSIGPVPGQRNSASGASPTKVVRALPPYRGFSPPNQISYRGVKLPRVFAASEAVPAAVRGRLAAGGAAFESSPAGNQTPPGPLAPGQTSRPRQSGTERSEPCRAAISAGSGST